MAKLALAEAVVGAQRGSEVEFFRVLVREPSRAQSALHVLAEEEVAEQNLILD